MAMSGVDVGVLQTALLQVAEATEAASEAATSAQEAQLRTASMSGGAGGASNTVDWSTLINKLPVLEHASMEAEIKAFRDWSWQLCQSPLSTMNSSYDEELRKLFQEPPKGDAHAVSIN